MEKLIIYTVNGDLAVASFDNTIEVSEIVECCVPKNANYFVVNREELPSFDQFTAWEADFINKKVFVNIEKVKNGVRDKFRQARLPLLQKLDIDFMVAQERNDTHAIEKIKEQKNILRDVTKLPLPDNLNELEAFWPDCLPKVLL